METEGLPSAMNPALSDNQKKTLSIIRPDNGHIASLWVMIFSCSQYPTVSSPFRPSDNSNYLKRYWQPDFPAPVAIFSRTYATHPFPARDIPAFPHNPPNSRSEERR